jgi:hypothetical protein
MLLLSSVYLKMCRLFKQLEYVEEWVGLALICLFSYRNHTSTWGKTSAMVYLEVFPSTTITLEICYNCTNWPNSSRTQLCSQKISTDVHDVPGLTQKLAAGRFFIHLKPVTLTRPMPEPTRLRPRRGQACFYTKTVRSFDGTSASK